MNSKGIKTLEYKKIIEMLRLQAKGEATREKIVALFPMTEIEDIKEALEETEESVQLIEKKGSLPIGNFYNIAGLVTLCQKGAALNMAQLLKIGYNLKQAVEIKRYMDGDIPSVPRIESMCQVLVSLDDIVKNIFDSIDSENEMNSRASRELWDIRRKIDKKHDDIRQKINKIIGKSGSNAMLQDTIVTVRDGRYVIPVKQEYRSHFPGIIHQKSSSGATLFIEPQAVVNLNNEIKELMSEEQAEIDRILAEISGRIGERGEEIKNNEKLLIRLDFLMAKGRLALLMEGTKVHIESFGEIDLKKARHPLISEEDVVPIDIWLKNNSSTMVITGPNTGGKTVTLKTLGLFSMMSQTGLFIPAKEGSKLPIFKDIFVDIGDEQSIEQSLSTFSSHMTNIVNICKGAGPETLVLLDELGAGTDPTEGAALAISILEELAERGGKILATTHYTELKKYAISKDGVENASMEFSLETLSPTYKLIMGMPGKSNAFEISKKLGIDETIIDRAKELLDVGAIEFEDVIAAISEEKRIAEAERDEALELNLAMKSAKEDAEKKLSRAEERANKILEDSKEEARKIIKEAKNTAKEIREELKAMQKIQSLGERNKAMEKTKKKIADAEHRYSQNEIIIENYTPIREDQIDLGIRVRVVKLGQKGQIVSKMDSRGDILVQVGAMKLKCKTKDLELIIDGKTDPLSKKNRSWENKVKKKNNSYGGIMRSKSSTISKTIQVRGQNLEEAVYNVEKFIDDAMIAGLYEIEIVHGRGEGILRNAIRDILKKHPQVMEYNRAKYNNGGDGVTVVRLKK